MTESTGKNAVMCVSIVCAEIQLNAAKPAREHFVVKQDPKHKATELFAIKKGGIFTTGWLAQSPDISPTELLSICWG